MKIASYNSLPIPDILNPPNGAAGLPALYAFTLKLRYDTIWYFIIKAISHNGPWAYKHIYIYDSLISKQTLFVGADNFSV